MQQDDLIGTTLGNYRILAPLGQGGMARVYRAHQENLDREVAVKVLPPWYAADESFVERFKLEAKLVARLSHANIVMVHDAGEQNGHGAARRRNAACRRAIWAAAPGLLAACRHACRLADSRRGR